MTTQKEFFEAIETALEEMKKRFKSIISFEFNDHTYYLEQCTSKAYHVQLLVNDADGINDVRTTLFTYVCKEGA